MILPRQPMINIQHKIVILFLIVCTNSHSMMRRPCIRAHAQSYVSRNLNAPRIFPRAYSKLPTRHYSQANDKILKAIEKQIKECQISEHEFLLDYTAWDHIISECAWKGKCLADGKCTKESNCLANGQMAYLAWKAAQKETVAYEVTLRVLLLEQACSAKSKFKK